MKSSLYLPLVVLSLALPPLLDRASAVGEPQIEITPRYVDGLLAEAQGRNPALEAAGARADAASAAVGSVRSWEDPVFILGLWGSTPRGIKASEAGDIIYGLQQRLPVFGRPELARQVAEAAAVRERLTVSYETESLRRDLTDALLELALADREIDLARRDLDWVDATAASVDSRYRSGKASQVEWLRVQTERIKAAEALNTLRLGRVSQQEAVNRLLNRDLFTPWPTVALPDVASPVPFDDRLVFAALNFEPRLRVLKQETARNEAAALLTKRQRLPDVGIGVQTRQYSGDGGFREGQMTVNFSVPWLHGSRYDSDIVRDKARARAAERDAEDYAIGVREEVHHVSTDLDTARRQALLYRDQIIPLTEQTLSSAQTAWENGLGLLQDALDAHRLLVENRLILVQAVAEQRRKLAELTLLTGISDPASFAANISAKH